MNRKIAGSEAHHRQRGTGIVAELRRRPQARTALSERLGALLVAFLSLYLGKRS